ncbi:MAG: polyprenyl synthetase family protein [Mariprofundaceae bacterium]|nr:polyprenyl synthetase family protein [Mariprofundaceae bacterium]
MPCPSFLKDDAEQTTLALSAMLDTRCPAVPAPLLPAMRYALMAGGKRIRPTLLLACYRACGGEQTAMVMNAAMAVECVHTYSLIHDDLPCMDDDDWRRGMPSCHKRFDEATAVLAGDALQGLGFELLTQVQTASDTDLTLTLIHKLAIAIGGQGMVGGQVLDMQAEQQAIDNVLEVERIHIHKTGALIRYCCEAGAMLAGANEQQQQACSHYGAAVGLLFQITDDILDVTASTVETGKSAGKDAAQGKATYVSLLGLSEARRRAANMCENALDAAEQLGGNGDGLQQLAHYMLERRA